MLSSFQRLRLREVIVGSGAPVLFLSDQLGRRGHEWNKNLYLQVLSGSTYLV